MLFRHNTNRVLQCQDTVAIEVAMIATENMMIEAITIAIDPDHNTMVDEAMEPAIMV